MTPDRRTIAETLRDGAARLAAAGIDNPRLESRLLLAHALGATREDLIRGLHAPAGPSAIDALLARRATHAPLAYILGWREFWSLQFHVSPATLIPRADSETVVAAALDAFPEALRPLRVLDLGTGTGCLLLAVLSERSNAFGVGVDVAEAAASLARRNANDLGLGQRAAFLVGDWAASLSVPLAAPLAGRFDLVVSNPPYIATSELGSLMPEVAAHEPRAALDGGASGLAAYRAIIAELPGLLAPSGVAVLELGIGQADSVAGIAESAGFRAETRPDLAGIARAMILRRPP